MESIGVPTPEDEKKDLGKEGKHGVTLGAGLICGSLLFTQLLLVNWAPK